MYIKCGNTYISILQLTILKQVVRMWFVMCHTCTCYMNGSLNIMDFGKTPILAFLDRHDHSVHCSLQNVKLHNCCSNSICGKSKLQLSRHVTPCHTLPWFKIDLYIYTVNAGFLSAWIRNTNLYHH
jgi:hypothetical protein